MDVMNQWDFALFQFQMGFNRLLLLFYDNDIYHNEAYMETMAEVNNGRVTQHIPNLTLFMTERICIFIQNSLKFFAVKMIMGHWWLK